MGESKTIKLQVTDNLANLRADIGLTQAGVFNSRSQIKKIFTDKKVFINGLYVKPSQLLKLGDEIVVEVPLTTEETLEPYDFPINTVFEDDDIIIVNKPAGLVVHPACGHYQDTLVNALMFHQKVLAPGEAAYRPGLVHRIDKDTSGLLVIAKNEKTHSSLARQFKNKTVHRVYHAVVFGRFKEPKGKIESFIARSAADRKKFASTDDPAGKWAITNYEVLREGPHFSFVQLKLETGRTHQIRVHLSTMGHPIVGDDTYNGKNRANGLASQQLKKMILEMPRFALHAKELGFVHPGKQERIYFDSEWPEDLQELLKLCHLEPKAP